MFNSQDSKWIRTLERKIGWLAVPNLAVILVTLQALGSLFAFMDPAWVGRLALRPDLVLEGEVWRVVTFLALPLSTSPIWVIFSLWFMYFVVDAIESQWGAFKTTLYVLVSYLVTIAFSFAFNYSIFQIKDFESTLFLAAAALYPEMEVQVFFILPVKMKWLAWLSLATLAYNLLFGDWISRLFLIAIYSNCLLFFGPAIFYRGKQMYRKWDYESKLRK